MDTHFSLFYVPVMYNVAGDFSDGLHNLCVVPKYEIPVGKVNPGKKTQEEVMGSNPGVIVQCVNCLLRIYGILTQNMYKHF